ncbi:MAG: type III PLP-dependent enzyme [Sneathiellales bacterium]|nr:type III PLP-dependent enzyme [Sneathiellales bacterium]
MVRPSQPSIFRKNSEGKAANRLCPATRLRLYSAVDEAIVNEACNDALHLLFPEILEKQATLFLDGFAGSSLYAIKSNPHPAVLRLLWEKGMTAFEVASLKEVEYLQKLLPDAVQYFMHPVKSREAIARSYERGVRHFAFDCLAELKKIEEETGFAKDLSLFLRVHVDETNAAYPLAGKFGASLQEMPLLLQRAAQNAERIGVTFHVGSQCMDPQDYVRSIRTVGETLKRSGIHLDMLDIGGGFPVYYPGMEPVSLTSYFEEIETAVVEAGLAQADLLCEPGRALVAEAGAVAVRVELRKGQALYLNDGTYGALFDAGVSNWKYPLRVIDREGLEKRGAAKAAFRFFGPTCDSLDVMEGPYELAENIEEGDWILFENLGAYGFAMQTRFNGFYSETVVSVCNK